jgi:RHS repeat-associated protein
MDGNGNVMGLQGLGGAKDGQTVARYDYDAFGNRITNTAPELGEDVCPFGFSTKLTDGETGLVYYGYRYYSPELGSWLSRDPIEEEGGTLLYGMLGNDLVNQVDVLGNARKPKDEVPNLTWIVLPPEDKHPPGPGKGICGAGKIKRRWKLSAVTPVGGYIVQKVTFQGKVENCAGENITAPIYRGDGYKYTEAWSVSKGRDSPQRPDDTFEYPGDEPCSKGEMEIRGEAQFFSVPGVPLPPQFVQGKVGAAGGLPSAFGHHSPFAENGSNIVKFVLKLKWDCCSGEEFFDTHISMP